MWFLIIWQLSLASDKVVNPPWLPRSPEAEAGSQPERELGAHP